MREYITSGSRWQGMEAKIWYGYLRHSQEETESNELPSLSLRRHFLNLPADGSPRHGPRLGKASARKPAAKAKLLAGCR